MGRLTFGIKTAPQDVTYDEVRAVWRDADRIESIEHAWLFDHFAPINGHLDGPCLEGWTALAALAAETTRLRVGLMVTGNTYRHPAVLAKIAATVDVISNGRLDLGLGAGWNVYEHESMGIPLYAPGERIRRLGEACEIIKRLFTQHLTTYEGRYYQLKKARCEPKPVQKPHPPFVLGGSGEQLTLRVVAQHAAVWNFGGSDPAQFKQKQDVLRRHCEAVGRDVSEIALSIQIQVFPDDLQKTIDMVQALVDAGEPHHPEPAPADPERHRGPGRRGGHPEDLGLTRRVRRGLHLRRVSHRTSPAICASPRCRCGSVWHVGPLHYSRRRSGDRVGRCTNQ